MFRNGNVVDSEITEDDSIGRSEISCDLCNKKYTSKHAMRHLTKVHKLSSLEAANRLKAKRSKEGSRLFTCAKCGKQVSLCSFNTLF